MARSLRATQQALDNIVEPARVRKRWNQQDEQWAEAAGVSLKTLQRFWQRQPIRQGNFIAICQAIGLEDWQAILDLPTAAARSSGELRVYPDATWVERSAVTASLLPILQSDCRVVAIAGITGIGKTALVERLVAAINDDRQWCRLNLDDGGIETEFSSSGAAFLRVLGDEPTLADQKDPANLRDHILERLRAKSVSSPDRRGEGNALGNLGIAYNDLGEHQRVIDFHQQALTISREIGDRHGEGCNLGNLGEAQTKLGQYEEALENLKVSLAIFQEIQSPASETKVLKMLADLYHKTDQPTQARGYCEAALQIATELGIPLAEDCQTLMEGINKQDAD